MRILLLPITILTFVDLCGAGEIFTSVRVHPGLKSPPPAEWTDFEFSQSASTSSASGTSTFGSSSFSGSATAQADFGVLKSSASAIIEDYEGVNYYGTCPSLPSINCSIYPSSAYAAFGDTFTFSGGTGTGYLVIDFAITGSATSSGTLSGANGGAQGLLNLRRGTQFNFGGTQVDSEPFFGDLSYASPSIQFTYGTPLAINAELVAFVWISDQFFSSDTVYDHTGTANFGNTAQVSGLRVFSDAGLTNQVAGVSVTSGTGTTYPMAAVSAVPEPATVLGLGGGLLLLAGLKRPRSRSL